MRTPITAALLREPGRPLELAEVLLDEPDAHEVVVRTERVGLCHSDLHYVSGALSIATPAVLGHEVTGVVQAVGTAVTNVAEGDRVVATITPSCGLCPACLRGRPTQCSRVEQARLRERPKLLTSRGDEVTVLGDLGGFAEYIDHYLAGRLDLDAMITAELPFARINDGFARMPDPGTIRIVLAF